MKNMKSHKEMKTTIILAILSAIVISWNYVETKSTWSKGCAIAAVVIALIALSFELYYWVKDGNGKC